MEVRVRLLGVVLRLLNFILTPFFWIFTRDKRRLPPITDPLLLESASSLAEKIRNGELTSERVVLAFIDRIQTVNPYLNAVVENRFEIALEEARAVDHQLSELRARGQVPVDKPLWGVPFTVKESCSLAGLSSAVGCKEFRGRHAAKDGSAVKLVREAGAIPLLVSNTPEFCLGWETSNLLNGTTNNPYCLARTPGGSSGGEAALLASGASPFGVASDIAGSIRVPSAFTGIFGHKPTPGYIPIEGHIPSLNDENFAKFLTLGPMARKAEDLPLLVKIMSGENAKKLHLDTPVDIKDVKVFYMTEATTSPALIDVDKEIKTMVKTAANYLSKECGATLSEEKFKELDDSVEISVSVFFSMKDLPNLLQDPANPKKEKNLILELIKSAFGVSMRSFQALIFALITKTNLFIPKNRTDFYKAKANYLLDEMKRRLGTNGVLLYPGFSGVAHPHKMVFVRASGVMYPMMFNILGMPVTSVPLSIHNGLPIGIQVIAAPNQDRLCLAVAKELQKGFGGWQPPT